MKFSTTSATTSRSSMVGHALACQPAAGRPTLRRSFSPLSRNYSRRGLGIGGWNDGESQKGGLFVEQGYLLLAVLLFVVLLAAVDVFLSIAQHAVEQHCQFVRHGGDRLRCPQSGPEAAVLRAQVALAVFQ